MRNVSAIQGSVSRGYEPVREAFAKNLSSRGERGGACCVYVHGEPVVDIWGGDRDAAGLPWERGTMVLVYSTTKGLSALTLALLHSRKMLDYDARVAEYWPEFAQNGKAAITVRQLLAHQAALFGFDEKVDRRIVADPDRLAEVIARQKPAWTPGTRQAYHAISLGFYEGELVRRLDLKHRTLGQFFDQEIARPLGADVFIRLPEAIPNARLAQLERPGTWRTLRDFPIALTLDSFNRRSVVYKSLVSNPGTELPRDPDRIYTRNLEVPSGGGVGSARGIACVYDAFTRPGGPLGIRPETIALLSAPAVPPAEGFYDACMRGHAEFSLGFMKSSAGWPFGSRSAFGAPGAGGSLGFADPSRDIAYAYVTSQMGTRITGDPRDVALREALSECMANRRAA